MTSVLAADMPDPERWSPTDSNIVSTDSLLLSRIALEDIIDLNAMGAFVGVAGTGKTFSFNILVNELEDVRVIWIEFEHEPTDLHMAQVLSQRLTGRVDKRRRYDISARILDYLQDLDNDRKILIVVDEAQRLTTKNFEYLRFLHDHAQSGFALALLGGNNAWQKIDAEPMLESRIVRRVNFERMSSEAVLKIIPNYHPMYADCSAEFILELDEFCHGVFRRWAQVTTAILKIHERNGVELTDEKLAILAASLVAERSNVDEDEVVLG